MPYSYGMTRRIEFTVSDDFWDQLEIARGREPRASFVKWAVACAIETTINDGGAYDEPPGVKGAAEGLRGSERSASLPESLGRDDERRALARERQERLNRAKR